MTSADKSVTISAGLLGKLRNRAFYHRRKAVVSVTETTRDEHFATADLLEEVIAQFEKPIEYKPQPERPAQGLFVVQSTKTLVMPGHNDIQCCVSAYIGTDGAACVVEHMQHYEALFPKHRLDMVPKATDISELAKDFVINNR